MTTRLLSTQRIVNIASDPATGTAGEIYFNTTTFKFRYHNGTSWINFDLGSLPTGGTTGQILAKIDGTNYNTEWIDNYTSQVKHLVKNDSGITLAKGTVVYTSGANGTNILVKPAQASNDQLSAQTLGFLDQELLPNATGFVIVEGLITGLNTVSASAGSAVWLSPTTPGGVIYGLANKPQAPDHLVYLGVVTRSNAINGEIFVHISNGWELEELHNVRITNLQDGQVLTYSSASGIWINQNATGGSSVGNVQTDTYLSHSWWLGV